MQIAFPGQWSEIRSKARSFRRRPVSGWMPSTLKHQRRNDFPPALARAYAHRARRSASSLVAISQSKSFSIARISAAEGLRQCAPRTACAPRRADPHPWQACHRSPFASRPCQRTYGRTEAVERKAYGPTCSWLLRSISAARMKMFAMSPMFISLLLTQMRSSTA